MGTVPKIAFAFGVVDVLVDASGFSDEGSDDVVWDGLPKLNSGFLGAGVLGALPKSPLVGAGVGLLEAAGENKPPVDAFVSDALGCFAIGVDSFWVSLGSADIVLAVFIDVSVGSCPKEGPVCCLNRSGELEELGVGCAFGAGAPKPNAGAEGVFCEEVLLCAKSPAKGLVCTAVVLLSAVSEGCCALFA